MAETGDLCGKGSGGKGWLRSGKEWRMKRKRSGVSTSQSNNECSVGDTYQQGSICGKRARRRVTGDGDSQSADRFGLDLRDLPGAGRSSSSSLARTVCLGWVSGADVKLLFGHLSDRGPRRLPVSAGSVRGHRPRCRLQAQTSPVCPLLAKTSVLRVVQIFQRCY